MLMKLYLYSEHFGAAYQLLYVALRILDYLELLNRNGWITIRSIWGLVFVCTKCDFEWNVYSRVRKHSLSTINLSMVLYTYTFHHHPHRRRFRKVWAFQFINTKRKKKGKKKGKKEKKKYKNSTEEKLTLAIIFLFYSLHM